MRKRLIKLLGGFTKEEVLTTTVVELYNTIGEQDILQIKNGKFVVGDKFLNEGETKLLVSEAQLWLNSRLWKVLQDDIKYKANQAMFEKAKSIEDLTAGKLWLYTLDCIATKLNKIINL